MKNNNCVIFPRNQDIRATKAGLSMSLIPSWNVEENFELSGPFGDNMVVNIIEDGILVKSLAIVLWHFLCTQGKSLKNEFPHI